MKKELYTVVSAVDVSQSLYGQYVALKEKGEEQKRDMDVLEDKNTFAGKRLLKMVLEKDKSFIVAIENKPLPFRHQIPPRGTVLELRDATVHRGVYLLDTENTRISFTPEKGIDDKTRLASLEGQLSCPGETKRGQKRMEWEEEIIDLESDCI
ncbi:MAG: uncharacterized protein A8A55_0936 [Amphiamblys sp. WSBS2006]|nr:MAG: uncharacterized protein A8A55_0936 [Amphiamblys sp. WSBS2006]